LFRDVINIKDSSPKLSMDNFNKIVNIKAAINWGISNKLKSELKFLKIVPVKRPIKPLGVNISDPHWISGFVSGDGCFLVKISSGGQRQGQCQGQCLGPQTN